ncbi:unnamed protein product [Porites lobata]|uniref:Uncharacterized protein n=1 Tax=Porites lobata TaxID=104759 RepID=A0ABN8NLQ3_9CNID|nr:unnamed protein product [Porites lobata]
MAVFRSVFSYISKHTKCVKLPWYLSVMSSSSAEIGDVLLSDTTGNQIRPDKHVLLYRRNVSCKLATCRVVKFLCKDWKQAADFSYESWNHRIMESGTQGIRD